VIGDEASSAHDVNCGRSGEEDERGGAEDSNTSKPARPTRGANHLSGE
jgi:hypothetical protein